MARKIYLAGPDVFLENALEVAGQKQALCERFGFEGLFPLDQDVAPDAAKIFLSNHTLMERADIGLFNLTPFRGPSADAGTVWELGFMFASGKPVYGYSSATRGYVERVAAREGELVSRAGMRWDPGGHSVEDFGLTDNLMIERSIREAGGTIILEPEPGGDPLAALAAFEKCLAVLAENFPAARGAAGP